MTRNQVLLEAVPGAPVALSYCEPIIPSPKPVDTGSAANISWWTRTVMNSFQCPVVMNTDTVGEAVTYGFHDGIHQMDSQGNQYHPEIRPSMHPGLILIPNLRDAGLGQSFSFAVDIMLTASNTSFGAEKVILSTFSIDPDEVAQMQYEHSLRQFDTPFQRDIQKRKIKLYVSAAGVNMKIGRNTGSDDASTHLCLANPRPLPSSSPWYHLVFRFNADTGRGSIWVHNTGTGLSYSEQCDGLLERQKAGRHDVAILGLELLDIADEADNRAYGDIQISTTFSGEMAHIMFYDFAISDNAASILYTDTAILDPTSASQALSVAYLAVTGTKLQLVHVGDDQNNTQLTAPNGVSSTDTCVVEDNQQPFMFWRKERPCAVGEQATDTDLCYQYYAG